MKNIYLERYAWPGPILSKPPQNNTNLIVVIPCYNEPGILDSLESLFNCDPAGCHVEVITVINHSENESQEIKDFNLLTFDSILNWVKQKNISDRTFHVIKAFDLPYKLAGVGLARKIGMDEAVRRFDFIHNKKGIIVWFDADCLCTPNYLKEIQEFYRTTSVAHSAQTFFEHPLEGELDKEIYDAIANYELHMRYYKNALRFSNFPYSFHTVGSCITVTSEAYQKQGGMNTRKAGEDFYFLQKIFQLGPVYSINTAKVIPSPRPSNRVPFGTGKAIKSILDNPNSTYKTYNPRIFADFKSFVSCVPELYHENNVKTVTNSLPDSIQRYLVQIQFEEYLAKIRKNCASESQFIKSFFNWFNGFLALKFVHFAQEHFYDEIEILEAANWILEELSIHKGTIDTKRDALKYLRDMDRSS